MKALLAVALLLLLAGCSGPAATSDATADAVAAEAPLPLAGALASERKVMQFAGGHQEFDLPIEVSFGAAEFCMFSGNVCNAAQKQLDLTPVVPASVPVELTVTLSGDADVGIELVYDQTTVLRSSLEYNDGAYQLAASLVRGPSGTFGLTLQYYNPVNPNAATGPTLSGVAHAVSRADVVPAFVPAAVQLGPGDTIRASGDGLEELVLFPPSGAPLRASSAPFNLTVPEGAPVGEYLILADADEAVRLRGPDRPMTARQLQSVWTEPVDLVAGQETTWGMDLPAPPILAGVTILSKPTVDGNAVGSYAERFEVGLATPGGFDVVAVEEGCVLLVTCGVAIVGYMTMTYRSDLLDERLVPGAYSGSVRLDSGRDMMAYSWAVTVA